MGIDKKLSVDDKQIYYVNSQTPEIYRRHLFSSTFTGAPAKEISVFLTPVNEANCPWVADRPLQMPGATQYFLRAEKHHPRSEKKKKKKKRRGSDPQAGATQLGAFPQPRTQGPWPSERHGGTAARPPPPQRPRRGWPCPLGGCGVGRALVPRGSAPAAACTPTIPPL